MAKNEPKITAEKRQTVEDITLKIKDASMIILSDFRGLNVAKLTEFRRELRNQGAEAKVYKNTLTRLAFKNLNLSYPDEMLQGPTILVSSVEDMTKLTKTVVEFGKKNEALVIKGGVLDAASLDSNAIKELAKLPSREELIGQAVALIKAPLTALVMNLSSPLRGFGNVLTAIKNKKDGGES